ncbi:MAG: hypothetical protein KC488_07260 [Candidatus Cloacimonetes bacterium]|nr:hypothetical protein [Candidatus Cloacimonadota bacterium]
MIAALVRLLVPVILILLVIRLLQQTGLLNTFSPPPQDSRPEPGEFEDLGRKDPTAPTP